MDTNNDSATLAYIRYVLRETNMSPTRLAKETGISPTTLTRPLNKPGYKFNLSATTIEKISQASGISPAPFFNNKDFVSSSLAIVHEPDVYDKKIWNTGSSDISLEGAVTIGKAALGFWQEVGKTHEIIDMLFIRHSKYASKDCFSVVMADSHAHNVAYIDDYLLCIRISAYDHELSNGEYVILERRKDGGRLIELTVRQLLKLKNGWQLNTPGHGNRYLDQVTMPDLAGDEEARIVGVVEYAVRRPI